jgi:branched-chain amino acid transport system permease protein
MLALGLTLAFGVMRLLNLAHGEFYMLGAYGIWLFYSSGIMSFIPAVVVSIVLVAVFSIIVQRLVYRPLIHGGDPMVSVLGAIGIMFILQVFVGQVWGLGLNKPIPRVYFEPLQFFDANVDMHRLIVIIGALVLVGGLWFFLQRVKMGKAMRACTQDPEAASLQGIGLDRMHIIAMAMAGALAGAAGALMAPLVVVNPYMGTLILLKAAMIIIVGGMGSIEGALIAGFLFGFLDSGITAVADNVIANLVGLVLMLIILSVRPRGLLGREV